MKNRDKVFRNYAHDIPGTYLKIYQAMCDCFDEHQKDFDGVDKKVMMAYIMRATKGSANPKLIQKCMDEFETR